MGRSRRHLSEFSMLEAEVAFVDNISSIVDIVENLVRESVASVIKTNYDDIETYLNFRTTRKVKNRSYKLNQDLLSTNTSNLQHIQL